MIVDFGVERPGETTLAGRARAVGVRLTTIARQTKHRKTRQRLLQQA